MDSVQLQLPSICVVLLHTLPTARIAADLWPVQKGQGHQRSSKAVS